VTKNSQKAARIVADAETRALLVEQEMRHQREAEADRRERDQLLRDFKSEIARDRVAQVAADTALVPAEATPVAVTPVTPPRDVSTGRWLPAAPEPASEPVDPATLSMEQYAAMRGQMGMDGRGIERVGRAPGHERSEFLGHRIEDGSGFPSWQDMSAGNRVFNSQLPDNRRPTPIGYQRQASAEKHSEWS
jgi:hypothetical protein